jgi:multiple sugar transport system permease protein
MAETARGWARPSFGISRRLDRLSERTFALVVSVPSLLLVALVVLPPTLAVFGLSLFRIELIKDNLTPFVGLSNYTIRLPADEIVLAAIPRTILFAAAVTAVTLPLALVTALVLNKAFRGASVLFMAVLMPWAVASIVAGIFWRYIFDTQFGIANGVLIGLGIIDEPINWLRETWASVALGIVATAWRSVPLLALLLLAALRTIPSSQYRAARMDGATAWQTFRYVTLPSIRGTLIIVAVLQVIIGLQVFDLLYSLTGGGPGRDTYVLSYAIFDKAFRDLSFGYASTLTVVLFAIIAAFSMLVVSLRLRRRAPTIKVDDDDLTARPTRIAQADAGHAAALAALGPVPTPARRRLTLSEPVRKVLFGVLVVALLLFFIAPIAWMAISSLQPYEALARQPPSLRPELWLEGYQLIYGNPRWFGSLIVSLVTSLLTTLIVILIASPAAYSLARFRLPGRNLIIAILVFTQMVPAVVMAIPILVMFRSLGLTDTIAALVIVNTAFWLPLIVWLLSSFFSNVPASLERAARIDGCSRLGTLFRVTVPAASPGIAAASILVLIGTWNEFLFAVILGQNRAVTITRLITGIQNFPSTLNQTPPPNLLATGAMVAVLPCLLLVLLFHRRIISGLTEGFVKG